MKEINYVKPSVIARRLDVSRQTVNKWYREGRIPGKCIGRHTYRYVLEDVLKAVEAMNYEEEE